MKWTMAISTLHASDGGPSHAVLRVARELALEGHDVTIVAGTLRGEPLDRAYNSAVQSGVIPIFHTARRTTRFRLSVGYFWKLIRASRNTDVVTCHGFYQFTCVAAYATSLMYRRPLLIQPHGVFEPYQEARGSKLKPLFKWAIGDRILRRATYILAASNQEVAGIDASLGKAMSGKTVVVGLGTDFPAALPQHSFSGRRVIFLSRIAPKKRLDVLISAAKFLAAEGRPIELSVCGDGSPAYEATLRELARGLDVTWHGRVEGEARRQIESHQDLFCLPSDNENFGQAVTEAMAVGLPVLTTSQTGASEHVRAGSCGVVLDDNSPAMVARAIDDMLQDRTMLYTYSENGLTYSRTHLSWKRVAQKWRDLL